jgi:hypothetical protein
MEAMADKPNGLETKLNDLFVKSAPKLPDGGKKALVQWAPILALIAGVLSLLAAWNLWHWAHVADQVVNYANAVCSTYGGYACGASASRYSLWLWLGVLFLLVEGLLYLTAYSGLKSHKKEGWNYLFYALVLNVVYAVVSLFDSYNVVGNFVGTLIASAIGFYFLFQIRESYVGGGHKAPTAAPKDK